VAGVGSAIYGLGLNLENFPKKHQIFQFFSLRVKKNLFGLGRKVPESKVGRPLICCLSKVSLGRAGSGPISNRRHQPLTRQVEKKYQNSPKSKPKKVCNAPNKKMSCPLHFTSRKTMFTTDNKISPQN